MCVNPKIGQVQCRGRYHYRKFIPASINTEIRSLYSVSLKLCGDGVEKCVLCVSVLGWDCVALRSDSQSKHTRSILIPRSVAVNVEAEAEYISRRRNEVSLLVNKHG